MAQRSSGYTRQPDDAYETPAPVTRAIVPYLRKLCLRPWDPANGPESKMVRVLCEEGFRAIGTSRDFLSLASPPDNSDAVATNPPYGTQGRLAVSFIEHALELVPVVAMLLRVDFDSGKTRTHLFRDCAAFAGKVTLLDRIMWFSGDSGPSDNHAWYLWNRNHRGPPTIRYTGFSRMATTTTQPEIERVS